MNRAFENKQTTSQPTTSAGTSPLYCPEICAHLNPAQAGLALVLGEIDERCS